MAAKFAEEKPSLKPLPLEPFRKYQFGDRRVNLDGCVEVETAYYSTPPGWIGRHGGQAITVAEAAKRKGIQDNSMVGNGLSPAVIFR